jgi:UPF0755 protein
VLVVLALIGSGAWYGITQLGGIGGYDDYSGAGERDLIVEVAEGASTGDIAANLQQQDVVASSRAFLKAAEGNAKIRAVQPGYYVMRTKISGADAVAKILDPASRTGNLEIRAGNRLADLTKPDGNVEPGIITKLSEASCADLNGQSTCVPAQELRRVAETGDLATLGVPDWAVVDAGKLEPARRLEGLIMPDVYHVKPGSSAEQLWQKVLGDSAVLLQSVGMPNVTVDSGFTPYQVMVMASLIQSEAIEKDFAKVSRVTYNRLAKPMRLEYDSTVNYMLDRPAIRTRKADRDRPGPHNTYVNEGLPPGPISSPSKAAVGAAVKPVDGSWLYFVRCEKDGTSCFADTDAEHNQNVAEAQARGAY